jgi:hypothetical protein
MKDMMTDPKINIQYASKYSNSSNYWKYSIGQNEVIGRLGTKAKKEAFEAEFTRWVNADPARVEKYGNALSLIENAVKARAEKYNAQQYMNEAFRGSCELIGIAGQLRPLEEALANGDKEKVADITGRSMKMMDNFYEDYNYPTDRKVTRAMLKLFKEDVDPKFWPDFYIIIDRKFKGNIDAFVDDMFTRSFLTTPDKSVQYAQDFRRTLKATTQTFQKDSAHILPV